MEATSQVRVVIECGDALAKARALPSNSVDYICIDPPYGHGLDKPGVAKALINAWMNGQDYRPSVKGFNGNEWDGLPPSPTVFAELFRVLKPGGYMTAFAAKRTVDVMGVAIFLGGFIIKDRCQWVHAQGVPKSRNLYGHDIRLDLRATYEPIIVAQKLISEKTYAENMERWGTGGINSKTVLNDFYAVDLITDGSEVANQTIDNKLNGVAQCPYLEVDWPQAFLVNKPTPNEKRLWLDGWAIERLASKQADDSSIVNQNPAAEYNYHPTVKPVTLMSHLVRLFSKEGATVLDCFCGSGSTGVAAALNGRNFIGIDQDKDFVSMSEHRIKMGLERFQAPHDGDFNFFVKFVDAGILNRLENDLRQKIINGSISLNERKVYRALIEALAVHHKPKKAA